MKKESLLLMLICIVLALALFVFALWNAITSPDFLSIDNLFITLVFVILALMFFASPLLFLKSEGKLPMPFKHGASAKQELLAAAGSGSGSPRQSLLDSKGRAVPPDVSNLVGRFTPAERKD